MTMHAGGYRALTQSVSQQLATLRTDMPDVMKGFGDLARAATRDGALDRKTKEFIALALGIAAHCDACIGFHVQALVSSRRYPGRIRRDPGHGHLHGRRPSAMYCANALAAFEEFSVPA